jgi:hypothetical protein
MDSIKLNMTYLPHMDSMKLNMTYLLVNNMFVFYGRRKNYQDCILNLIHNKPLQYHCEH